MGNIKLAILHRDHQYAKDFSEALAEHWKSVGVFVVSSSEETDAIDAGYILTDNSPLASEFKERGIHLYDDVCDVQDDVFSLDRFQPMRAIVSQLIEHCVGDANVNYRSLQDAGNTSFIGITSGIGGAGTSSLSVCMGRILSRLYQKKVLYISFEVYKPSFYAFFFNGAMRSADRLLYHLVSKNEDHNLNIEEYLSEDTYSLKYISSKSKINPLSNTEEDDAYQFLNYIACCGRFEIVILDVPCSFPHHKSAMRMCEKQVVNFGFKRHCQIPSELVKEDLEELGAFDSEGIANRLFEFRPLEDPDSFILTDKGFDIDIHGQFGAEVRALVDSMEIG